MPVCSELLLCNAGPLLYCVANFWKNAVIEPLIFFKAHLIISNAFFFNLRVRSPFVCADVDDAVHCPANSYHVFQGVMVKPEICCNARQVTRRMLASKKLTQKY